MSMKTFHIDDAPEPAITATLEDFIDQMLDADVEFTREDFDAIDALAVGESTAIGISIITRTVAQS